MARPASVLAAVTAVIGLGLAGAAVVDQLDRDQIAPGSRIAGVPVGGLSREAAVQRLRSELLPRIERTVAVRAGARTFWLTARRAGVSADLGAMAAEAVRRSRQGFFLSRAIDDITGAGGSVNVPIQVRYSRTALAQFVARIAGAVDTVPVDAGLGYEASGIRTTPARPGREVESAALLHELAMALSDPRIPRELAAPIRSLAPRVTARQLSARYPRIIVVDRESFTPRLYENLRLARSYPIAVGMIGLQTPAGLYHVQDKQVDPWWAVPHDAWAGSLDGKLIPPGPQDPLKARWMGFDGGAGIHGIDPSEYSTIGHDASHGCIRMTIPDVISLYGQVSVGTPVYIA